MCIRDRGLDLESPANEPQYNKHGFLELGISPEQAPDKPTYVTIHFEKGIPTAVDGKEMGAVELVEYLNKLGGENGIGLLDIVENRLVGMKSRGVYAVSYTHLMRRKMARPPRSMRGTAVPSGPWAAA